MQSRNIAVDLHLWFCRFFGDIQRNGLRCAKNLVSALGQEPFSDWHEMMDSSRHTCCQVIDIVELFALKRYFRGGY